MSPRLAGESDFYQLGLVTQDGRAKGRLASLPSVTAILTALPKGGLEWWGYRMGLNEGRAFANVPDLAQLDEEKFYEEVKRLGREGDAITPANALKKAGTRGTEIHDLAERLFNTGKLPPKEEVEPERQPYAQALWTFYKEKIEGKEILAVEEPVFSVEHGYAGTVDLIAYDLKLDLYFTIDFKTSKEIFPNHLLQVTAYDHAARERGWIPPHAQSIKAVVRLGQDGKPQVGNSFLTIDDFLVVKRSWELQQRLREDGNGLKQAAPKTKQKEVSNA